jgi:hypothetical protein
MTEEKKIALKAAFIRFLRVFIPQIPAMVAQIGTMTESLTLPAWVAPTLSFIGIIATALDKYLRQMGVYE